MLQVASLSKQYGAVHSVQDVSFMIDDCETVGLLGRNGAGKSTLMRMISGYVTPTSGSVSLWGHSMMENPIEAKRCLGYLPELPPLYVDMTVNEHLQFVCALQGIPARNSKRECERVCAELNLNHVAGRIIGNLSKGYRQRVGFAAALVGQPRLLILDEPTVGLDPQQIIEVRSLIQRFSQNMSILISSHVLSEIATVVCTRLLVMHKGCLVVDGTPETIKHAHQHASIATATVSGHLEQAMRALANYGDALQCEALPDGYMRFTLTLSPKEIPEVRLFKALGSLHETITLHELRSVTPSLEEIFVSITHEGENANVGCMS